MPAASPPKRARRNPFSRSSCSSSGLVGVGGGVRVGVRGWFRVGIGVRVSVEQQEEEEQVGRTLGYPYLLPYP